MNKIKVLIGVLSVLIFGSFFHIAQASLIITDVMFDPEGTDTNREWVKVYNDGEDEVTIISGKSDSAWRFGDGPTGETLHYINENLVIPKGQYAILASDKDTFVLENSYQGLIADTSMSLSNTEGVVKIYDGSKPRGIIASKSYNNLDEENNITTNSESDNNKVDPDDGDSSKVSSSKKEPFVLKISTNIIAPKTVVAGVPFTFNSTTKTNSGQTYMVGKFVWNFGDGMNKELREATPFEYYYDYPGEYKVNLYYYDNHFALEPDAVSNITIKVVEPEIFISSVGNYLDPYIEIESKSSYETDLSNWVLTTSSAKTFIFPEGTTLLPNKKIKLSPKITQFLADDLKSVVISNPNKEIIVTFPQNKRLIKSIRSSASAKKEVTDSNGSEALSLNNEVINLNNLSASLGESSSQISPSTYAFIGLGLVILIGVTSFLLAKKKDNDNLEANIKAEDLSIIE